MALRKNPILEPWVSSEFRVQGWVLGEQRSRSKKYIESVKMDVWFLSF